MATNFPTALDNLANPDSSVMLSGGSNPALKHSAQHANANDAIEAIQAVIGIDGSAVTSSLQYRVNFLEGQGTASWLTGTIAPTSGQGTVKDWYLNTTTYDIYSKSTGTWVLKGNIKGSNGLPGSTIASGVSFTPAGSIAATNVQAALEELATEKADATSTTSTLNLKVSKTSATGSAVLPVGTTAQRDVAPAAGYLRFNDTTDQFEGYNGTAWGTVGGGATGGAGNPFIYENEQMVTVDYTLTTGKNGMSAGPITISNGISVTIPNGSVWTIV